MTRTDLSRLLSHALRHEPETYGLELDAEGWVNLDEVIAAVHRRRPKWKSVDEAAIRDVVENSSKRRYEIADGRIRAKYGHSVAICDSGEAQVPPDVLYHGTARTSLEAILAEGLRPMNRQRVHLSIDIETAMLVGRRKSQAVVLLRVATGRAHQDGLAFYPTGDTTWLTEHVPAKYLEIQE